MDKQRVDTLMVLQGLVSSIDTARALILAGRVFTGHRRVDKPGTALPPDIRLHVTPGSIYVGRGGLKLEHALRTFHISAQNAVAVDIGASTGGFTHCLLEHGAKRVYSVDVGYGQLDTRLRQNPRVVSMERTNARYPFHLPEVADIATVDISFISLTKVIPSVARHLAPAGRLVILVKPQFEAPRHQVGRGGIVRDPTIHAATLGKICLWTIQRQFRVRGITASNLDGNAGNREFFVLLEKGED